MDKEVAKYWVLLSRLNAETGRRLLDAEPVFSDIGELFAMKGKQLAELGFSETARDRLRKPDWDTAKADLAWLDSDDKHLLPITDPAYPRLLKELSDPPVVLFVHGDPAVLCAPQIAIVGSRNPTPAGANNARDFAAALARAGATITSGLALGIDGAAHQAALDAGGATVAVAGTGLDRVYPARHKDLAHRIAGQGALVSEFAPGTGVRRGQFPRRNRIISGLSLGTLVVEAATQSGSLITARLAGEQGREVFALPGSIHNPLARGCHQLIKQGAKLVETAEEILEELAALVAFSQSPAEPAAAEDSGTELGREYEQLLRQIDFDPTSVDEIVKRSGLSVEVVSNMLLLLELNNKVVSVAGGYTRC